MHDEFDHAQKVLDHVASEWEAREYLLSGQKKKKDVRRMKHKDGQFHLARPAMIAVFFLAWEPFWDPNSRET